jgi:DNA-binding IclR family transcriptional regulator
MVRLGLLERGPDRLLRVGVRLWELAWRSTEALGLRNVALPYLEALQSVVRQHTQLAVLEGTDVLYLEPPVSLLPSATIVMRSSRPFP